MNLDRILSARRKKRKLEGPKPKKDYLEKKLEKRRGVPKDLKEFFRDLPEPL